MARFIMVAAAQMGPVGRTESRADVVARLLELMREAKGQGCDLIVFTECALTPFFPRWWEDDIGSCDQWFEREMPSPDTQLLFAEALKLGIGFHLGYAELAEENGSIRHYNSSILVGPDGKLIGKYRKIHLSGQTTKDAENVHQSFEQRYFDVGDLGFRAWKAFAGGVGMCLGDDRRWVETYRVLALSGAELVLLGYNTAAEYPGHPELEKLAEFQSTLSMQAGAYQNGCFVVGAAKAGAEEGVNQIGGSAIIAPSGEILAQCTTLEDELIVHRCDLEQARFYQDQVFDFSKRRQIEAYGLIRETRGSIPLLEPAASGSPSQEGLSKVDAIEQLFTNEYGYSEAQARTLAKQAAAALALSATAEETSEPPKTTTAAGPADPIQAIENLFREKYGYPAAQIEAMAQAAERARNLADFQPATADEEKPEPAKKKTSASEILAKARGEAKSAGKPVAEKSASDGIGWLPGRFSVSEKSGDPISEVVTRLTGDYRYSVEKARQIAAQAEAALRLQDGADTISEPGPAAAVRPSKAKASVPKTTTPGKPLTKEIGDSPSIKTAPALSGKESLAVYSLFTEKYGYHPSVARGVAERAHTAWKRWQSARDAEPETAPAAKTSKKPVTTVTDPTPTSAVQEVLKRAEPAAEQTEPDFLIVNCPECEFPLKINQENIGLLGRKARCPKCQTKFRLPE